MSTSAIASNRASSWLSSDGLQVAVFNDGKSAIRKVRVTRDLGTQVEVDVGVKPGDRVILKPPINLVEGSRVLAVP
jgi:hypothetical protein